MHRLTPVGLGTGSLFGASLFGVLLFGVLGCGGAAANPHAPQSLHYAPFSLALAPNITLTLAEGGRLSENDVPLGTIDAEGRLMSESGDELAHLNGDGTLVVLSVETGARVTNRQVLEDGNALLEIDEHGVLHFPARTTLGPFPLPNVPESARTGVLFVVAAYFSLVDLATQTPPAT